MKDIYIVDGKMMTRNMLLTMDELVPSNHLVRKLEVVLDFSFIYPWLIM